MLSKDVCVKCWKETNSSAAFVISGFPNWAKRAIACPNKMGPPYVAIVNEDPPKWCEHKFEHAVAEYLYETH